MAAKKPGKLSQTVAGKSGQPYTPDPDSVRMSQSAKRDKGLSPYMQALSRPAGARRK